MFSSSSSTSASKYVAAFVFASLLALAPLSACTATEPSSPSDEAPVTQTDGPASPQEEGTVVGSSVAGSTMISEDALDSRIGSYTVDGTTVEITVRQVMEDSNTLASYMAEEGTYRVPSADDVLGYVRNSLLAKEAKNRGITVSEEDVTAYAKETFGSSDFEVIGASYGLDAETVKRLISSSAEMAALRKAVIGDDELTAPEMPLKPAEGAESEPTADYAAYIIGLAGDEWDSASGSWAAEGGAYQSALATYEITADSATYEAATAAYYVALNEYSTRVTEQNTLWSEFVNTLFSSARIEIDTLIA